MACVWAFRQNMSGSCRRRSRVSHLNASVPINRVTVWLLRFFLTHLGYFEEAWTAETHPIGIKVAPNIYGCRNGADSLKLHKQYRLKRRISSRKPIIRSLGKLPISELQPSRWMYWRREASLAIKYIMSDRTRAPELLWEENAPFRWQALFFLRGETV